jgi:NhaP-type Na+/H+ or K+/H+ antiporter
LGHAETIHAEGLLIGLTVVVVLGIGAQWLAWRLGLPSILLLLTFGFLAGPVGGWVDPDALLGDLLLPFVSLSVALILFEGGLSLKLAELREIGAALFRLMTVGVVLTAALSAAAAYLVLGFNFATSLILGTLLVVTGPTVIGPLLRHIRPVGRVGAIAKWEGIVVDPIGAVLAVLAFEAVGAAAEAGIGHATGAALTGMLRTVVVGCVGALLAALPAAFLLRHYRIPDFLHSPILLMLVLGAFTASQVLQEESGLLTVTLMGVILANQRWADVRHIVEFKENLRVLLISSLFVLLAARLQPGELRALGLSSIWFLALLLFAVRPVSVFIATLGSSLRWQEKLFLSWLAPRGIVAAAVSSVFALRLGEEGQRLVAATFLVIIGTVAVYGLSAAPLAFRLQLASPNPQGVLIAGAHPFARAFAAIVKEAGLGVLLVDSNRSNINQARMQGLPIYYASILSERSLDAMDLGGLGYLLAMTPNDEINSLAALHFSEVFGRGGVYQLASAAHGGERQETAQQHLHGRLLFDREATYDALYRRRSEGADLKRTHLTDEFDYEAFQRHYGPAALPLCVIDENGRLEMITAEQTRTPRTGDTLISLAVDPDASHDGENGPAHGSTSREMR